MQPSDAPYKVLFHDRGLVEETVRLVAPALADQLDFDTATALDKEHLTIEGRARLQDRIVRVEKKTGKLRNGRRPYVLVLFEFQSSVDADMVWRMREYAYLAGASLRQTGAVRAEGAVPDMLPVVVHNGEQPWRASAAWGGLLTGRGADGTAGLPAPIPIYATVDVRSLADSSAVVGRLPPGSRLAGLAGLETADAKALPALLVEAFARHPGPDAAGFRRGLHLRVGAVLERVGAKHCLPSLDECERMLAGKRGENMTAMLDATMARWAEAKVAEGLERGMAQGVERGMAQGVERGVAQGRLALLRRQAEKRFGTDAAQRLSALLEGVTDTPLLDDAGVRLMECDSGAELLAWLREIVPAGGNGAPGDGRGRSSATAES